MVEAIMTYFDSHSNKIRISLMIATGSLVCLLAVSRRAEAICNYQNCNTPPPSACGGDYCFHINDVWGYFDPQCTQTNCCVQGPCSYYDVYPESGVGCTWCSSGDTSQCGYDHGCP